jgi:uncharacterized LabA/DUF88 family protein
MSFYREERIALFIDGANFFSAARGLGVEIDYRKLLDVFRQRGRLIRAYYYTAVPANDDTFSPVRKLVDWLDYNGFRVVTKIAREYFDGMGRKRFKGDMDVDIAVDMLELAGHCDHMVLFSGDGDFKPLILALQARGVRVSVVSSMETQPSMVSDELRRAADNFFELKDMLSLIARPPRDRGDDYGAATASETYADVEDADDIEEEDEEEDDDDGADEDAADADAAGYDDDLRPPRRG